MAEKTYGWLLGFGKKARIIYPEEAIKDLKSYLDKVRYIYINLNKSCKKML